MGNVSVREDKTRSSEGDTNIMQGMRQVHTRQEGGPEDNSEWVMANEHIKNDER